MIFSPVILRRRSMYVVVHRRNSNEGISGVVRVVGLPSTISSISRSGVYHSMPSLVAIRHTTEPLLCRARNAYHCISSLCCISSPFVTQQMFTQLSLFVYMHNLSSLVGISRGLPRSNIDSRRECPTMLQHHCHKPSVWPQPNICNISFYYTPHALKSAPYVPAGGTFRINHF